MKYASVPVHTMMVASLFLNAHCFNTNSMMIRRVDKQIDLLSRDFTASYRPTLFSPIVSMRLQTTPGSDDSTAEEIEEVKKMILSVSKEEDDEKRRSKLSSLINEKMNQADEQFLQIWDKAIIQVGGELQDEARRKAVEMPMKEEQPVKKTKEELQLWAIVDMMVQSKTLIKKAMK